MSVKKSAYQYTTPEQAPLFMCAGEENAGKVPKVDRNGYITEFVEITGGGEPDEYIKNIVQNSNTYTAVRKNDETVEWIIPDVSLLAPKANAELTGTTQAENIVVSGDISAKSGTAVTDFDMSNAKTFIIPHITLIDPAEATSGTLTDVQLATLQSTECAYILFNGEKYYLNDKEHTTGSLGYSHCGYENNQFIVRNITITISTKGWVLTSGYINTGHLYQHTINITGVSQVGMGIVFTIFTDSDTALTKSTVGNVLTNYFSGVTNTPLICCGMTQSGQQYMLIKCLASSTQISTQWLRLESPTASPLLSNIVYADIEASTSFVVSDGVVQLR